MTNDHAIVGESAVKMNARTGQLRCAQCDAVFNKQSSLTRHGQIHSGAFRCVRNGCEKAFSERKHLSKHLNRHSSTNLKVRIVPFNTRGKVEVKDEPCDEFSGGPSQQSVQHWKRVKKEEEEEDDVKVKIEVKGEHDQIEDGDQKNFQTVQGFNCKKEEDDESYCGCDECDTEAGRHNKRKSQINDKATVEDDPQMDHSATYNPHCRQPHLSAGYEPEEDPVLLAQVKQEIKEEENEIALKNMMDNGQQNQENENCGEYEEDMIDRHVVSSEPKFNEEFGETNNELIVNQTHNRDTSLTLSNEQQSNHNLTNSDDEEEVQVNHDIQQLADETNNGEIMQIEEDDDETEIEDNEIGDDEETRSVENAQIETTLPHSIEQSLGMCRQSAKHLKRKQTDEVDNQEDTEDEEEDNDFEVTSRPVKRLQSSHSTTSKSTKQAQFITISLRCDQVNCEQMIDKNQFNSHMLREHSIRQFRCPVKDCGQSFEKQNNLSQHHAQFHKSTSQWHCDKCSNHFTSYNILSTHNYLHHQLGLFQCSVQSCTFTGEYRRKVYNHNRDEHKPQPSKKKCHHSGCQYETSHLSDLKDHKLVHLGIRPYRCKWTGCNYTSTRKTDTYTHIRRLHVKGKTSSSARLDEYIEVNEMLLNNRGQNDDESEDEDEDGDKGEVIEDNQEKVTSRSAKRPRPSRPTTSTSTKQKQIITVTLRCPQCGRMFAQDKLNDHVLKKHSICPFRCPVKNCKETFDNSYCISRHIVQSHQSTTEWHCNKCDKHCSSYILLAHHNYEYHQLGHFQCSFPSCTFTGEYRQKVYGHYYKQHKQTMKKCQHPGCQYETLHPSTLTIHQRAHLGIKPYKCKWSGCEYASVNKYKVTRHIGQMHVKPNPRSVPNGAQLDLKDYFEVVYDLL